MEAIRSINDDQLSCGFLVTVYFFKVGNQYHGKLAVHEEWGVWAEPASDLIWECEGISNDLICLFPYNCFFALDRWWFLKDAWHFGDFGNVRNVFWCSYISQSGNRGGFAYPTLWKYSKWKDHNHGTQPVMGSRSWFSVSKSGRVFRGCMLSLFPMV